MQRILISRLLAVGVVACAIDAAAQEPTPSVPNADTAWAACTDKPTRQCVLDRALLIVRSSKVSADKSSLRQQVRALLPAAEALVKAGRSKEAVAIFAQVRKLAEQLEAVLAQPMSYTPFVDLVASMARAGMGRQALETARSFKDDVLREIAIFNIAETQAKAGMIQEARETSQSIQDEVTLSDVLVAIVRAEAKAGLLNEARKTIQSIRAESAGRAEALAAIAEGEARAGLSKEAVKTFDEAITIAQARKLDVVFASIAVAQARAGLFDNARMTLQSIELDIVRTMVLASIAEAQIRAGRTKQGAATFDEAIKSAQSIDDPGGLRSEAHFEIAAAMANVGMFEEAIRIASTIDYDRIEALDHIATAMAEAGRTGDAIRIAQSFNNPLARARTLARISMVLPK